VPDGSTVETVWIQLAEEFPELAPHRAALAVAVDEEFARFTSPLRDGHVVALLPPVSGDRDWGLGTGIRDWGLGLGKARGQLQACSL